MKKKIGELTEFEKVSICIKHMTNNDGACFGPEPCPLVGICRVAIRFRIDKDLNQEIEVEG